MQTQPTIRLAAAIICSDARDEDGHFIIVDPVLPIVVPASFRSRAPIDVTVPPFKIVLILYGGREQIRLRFSARAASGEYGLSGEEVTVDWPGTNPWHQVIVPVDFSRTGMAFAESGPFEFGILANGVPIGSVGIPIVWSDEI